MLAMKAYSRLLVITLVCATVRVTVATSSIKSVNGLVTWSQAAEECSKYGRGFTLTSYNSTQSEIEREMTKNRHGEVWLNLIRKQLDNWEWVDGQPVDGRFAQGNWKENLNCGKFHLRDRTLEADMCSVGNYGIICRHEGNCVSFNGSRADCLDDGNSSLIFVGHADNWYDARYRCSQGNLTLAILQNEAVMDRLYQQWYLKDRKHPVEVWVGLRRQEWLYYGNTRSKVFRTHWASGQPSQDGNCTLLSRNLLGRRFQWKAASCNSSHKALCVRVTIQTDGAVEPPRASDVGTENSNMIIIICAAIGGLIVLAGIVIAIIYILRRKHINSSKRCREQKKQDTKINEMEIEPLKGSPINQVGSGPAHPRHGEAANSLNTGIISSRKSDEENRQNVGSSPDGRKKGTEKTDSGQNASAKENVTTKRGVAVLEVQNERGRPEDRLDKQNKSPRFKGLLAGYEKYDVDNKKNKYKPGDTLKIKELDISLEVLAGNIRIIMEGYRHKHSKKPVIVKVHVRGKSTGALKLRIPIPTGQHDKAQLVASELESGPWIAPNPYYATCTFTNKNAEISLKTSLDKYQFFMVKLKY